MEQQKQEIFKKSNMIDGNAENPQYVQLYVVFEVCALCTVLYVCMHACRQEGGRERGGAELCWETQREPGVQGEVSG